MAASLVGKRILVTTEPTSLEELSGGSLQIPKTLTIRPLDQTIWMGDENVAVSEGFPIEVGSQLPLALIDEKFYLVAAQETHAYVLYSVKG